MRPLPGGLSRIRLPDGALSSDAGRSILELPAQMAEFVDYFNVIWRRGGDSNPRYGCPYSAFRVRRDRPLCHLSVVATATSPGRWAAMFRRRQAKQERRRNDRDRRLDHDVQRIRRGREREGIQCRYCVGRSASRAEICWGVVTASRRLSRRDGPGRRSRLPLRDQPLSHWGRRAGV